MKEDLGSSSNAPQLNTGSKKNSKSRRRLHEAEVLSTTPCTAPVRRPQQDPTIIRSSLRGLKLDEYHSDHLRSSSLNSNSVGGTVNEYNRISNKTGGFEGALPLQYDAIFPNDDNTVHFDNTVKSSPELGQKADRQNRMNGGRDTTATRRRLFQRQRRSSFIDDNNQTRKVGFFKRWASISTSNRGQTVPSVGTLNQSTEKHQKNSREFLPPKLRLSSRGATSVTIAIEDNSERSVTKSMSQAVTPSRDSSRPIVSPRFMLPDETPPGTKGKNRPKTKPGSDNTSAAVIARSQISDDLGFELSISSAPPTYSTPRKHQNVKQQRSSIPVDLDEVDGQSFSSDESSVRKIRLKEEESLIWKQQNRRPVSRPSSLSPTRRRMAAPNRQNKKISRSAHSRLGVSMDKDDDVSKFSTEHLGGAIQTSGSLQRQQSSSDSERNYKGYGGLKRWILPKKRSGRGATPESRATKDIKFNYQASDEVQSVSPDQRESIFANMELVEKESSAGEYERRRRSTVKSTNHTQSTTSSSKDAPTAAVRLPHCVVCNFCDRTHIAVPCMHFAYCRECSMRLAKLGKGCVLCQNQNVTFAAVSV